MAEISHRIGRMSTKDGIIKLDSLEGKRFGFTRDRYRGWLWRKGDTIYVSLIECVTPGCGDFRRLVETIRAQGLVVKVPTPLGKMCQICEHMGFEGTREYVQELEAWTDVMVLGR